MTAMPTDVATATWKSRMSGNTIQSIKESPKTHADRPQNSSASGISTADQASHIDWRRSIPRERRRRRTIATEPPMRLARMPAQNTTQTQESPALSIHSATALSASGLGVVASSP